MEPNSRLRRVAASFFSSGLMLACLAALLSSGTTRVWAQSTSTSTVTGQVTDQQGASVPGAVSQAD